MKSKNTVQLFAGLLISATLLGGCGKESYLVAEVANQAQAPGHFIIPPRVDILLAQDDTGSAMEPYAQFRSEVVQFLHNLDAKGWDYHFVVAPLTRLRNVTEVAGSRHDSNYGSSWIPSYPGQPSNAYGMLPAAFFRSPDTYSQIIDFGSVSNNTNSVEPGLSNIRDTLYSRLGSSGFLRQDAQLVVMALGNGEDTSGGICTRSDGITYACPTSLETLKNQYLGLKSSGQTADVKFYAAVAATDTRTSGRQCLGGNAYKGARYEQFASMLGGAAFDICNQSISQALSSMETHLKSQRLDYRTRFIFLDREPAASTIRVVKYVNGNAAQAVEIPQDTTNGWTYAGYVTNQHAIDFPAPMNLSSGYAIELHGTAKLLGDDVPYVTFKPFGAQDAAAN